MQGLRRQGVVPPRPWVLIPNPLPERVARAQDFDLLAGLDETRPVLIACEGVAAFVNSILKQVVSGGERLSPHPAGWELPIALPALRVPGSVMAGPVSGVSRQRRVRTRSGGRSSCRPCALVSVMKNLIPLVRCLTDRAVCVQAHILWPSQLLMRLAGCITQSAANLTTVGKPGSWSSFGASHARRTARHGAPPAPRTAARSPTAGARRCPAAPSSVLRTPAGEYPAEVEWPVSLMRPVSHLCGASTPLAVELFCGGALGMLLRIAQRWLAAQPRGARDGSLAMVRDGLIFLITAFGRVVPEARTCTLLCPRPAA